MGIKPEYKIEKYAAINVCAVGGNNSTTKISRFCVLNTVDEYKAPLVSIGQAAMAF